MAALAGCGSSNSATTGPAISRCTTAQLEASEARLRIIFETGFQHQGLLTPDGLVLDANAT